MSKAYLIDPFMQTVNVVDHQTLEDIYLFIGSDCMDAAHVGSITKNDGRLVRVAIYVDDEGYYTRDQTWFRFGAYPNPLGGRGLLVGVDDAGDDIDPPIPVAVVSEMVTWLGTQTPDLPPVVHYTMGKDGPRVVASWDQNEERARRLKADGCDG